MISLLILIFILSIMYLIVSVTTGKAINSLTFYFAKIIIIELALTVLFFSKYGNITYSMATWEKFELSYFLFFLGLTLGYLMPVLISTPNFKRPLLVTYNQKKSSIVLCLCALVIVYVYYKISLITGHLPFTRAFYSFSRVGLGYIYYTGAYAAFMFAIISRLAVQKKALSNILFILGWVALGGFGSKALLLSPLVFLFYSYYVNKQGHISAINQLAFGVLILFALVSAFWFFLPENSHLLTFMIHYSDYVRNYLNEIQSLNKGFNGLLTFQNNFITLIPRIIWPSKPYLFGNILLAHQFYNFNIYHQQGVPSFGEFGLLWADFKSLSLIMILLKGFFIGWVLKTVEYQLFNLPNHVGFFVLFLSAMGLYVISPGVDSLTVLLVNATLGFLVFRLLRHNKRSANETISG